MKNLSNLYPANPTNVPASATKVSDRFKKEVRKVVGSIFLFFLVYLLLVVLAIALAIACVIGGVALMYTLHGLYSLAIGIGIIGLGVMVFVFLVKFIFAVKKYDESSAITITEKKQPRLFAFIRQLTIDTQTQFPKKIILSPDVNAGVFYNDSFWSMFLPVKKNLTIGLGLVNVLSISEFKAVLAHEFGHFSQRSMKLGSFVYNVNKVIYNMLFENSGYVNFINSWSRMSGYFAFFAGITVKIVQAIQWILVRMYSIINKNRMGLSREMEFHADAVAATVSGSQNLIHALRRSEIGDICYQTTIQRANAMLQNKEAIQNIFQGQQIVLHQYALDFKLETKNNVPVITEEFLQSHQHSKINFKDQWASHPTREEREAHLNQLNIPAETNDHSAWLLFDEIEILQAELTGVLYKNVPDEMIAGIISPESFTASYKEEMEKFSLPDFYRGYYNGRYPVITEVNELTAVTNENSLAPTDIEKIFSDSVVALPVQISSARSDAELLSQIAENKIQIKTFDYDGRKCNKDDASRILPELRKEIEENERALSKSDKEIFQFFYCMMMRKGLGDEYRNRYKNFADFRNELSAHTNNINQVLELMHPIFTGQTLNHDKIHQILSELKRQGGKEFNFKLNLGKWYKAGIFKDNPELEEKAKRFINGNYQYFFDSSFMDNELKDLHELISESYSRLQGSQFGMFKSLLVWQLDVYNNISN